WWVESSRDSRWQPPSPRYGGQQTSGLPRVSTVTRRERRSRAAAHALDPPARCPANRMSPHHRLVSLVLSPWEAGSGSLARRALGVPGAWLSHTSPPSPTRAGSSTPPVSGDDDDDGRDRIRTCVGRAN